MSTDWVIKRRAERQIAYRRETLLGVVTGVEAVQSADGSEQTFYSVLLPGQRNPIRRVYNASGLDLAPGDGVTLNRIGGRRSQYQILAKATAVPVDLAVLKAGRWGYFKWGDGTKWVRG